MAVRRGWTRNQTVECHRITGEYMTIAGIESCHRHLVRLACDNWRCQWRGNSNTVLRAPDPFNTGCELLACPNCREQKIRTCCDEPECWEQDTCGTPTLTGYRRTCGRHRPI